MTKSEEKVLSGVCNLLLHYRLVPIKKKRRKRKKYQTEVQEDLSNLFINLDVRKTPFLSRLKRETWDTAL